VLPFGPVSSVLPKAIYEYEDLNRQPINFLVVLYGSETWSLTYV
jgi:hypothetical protein